LKRNDEAIQDCSYAIELKPDFGLAFSCRGAARSGNKQFEQAVHDFSKAISLLPGHQISWCGRGIARCFLANFSDAQDDLQKAISLAPEYTTAKEWLNNAQQGMFLSCSHFGIFA
jgi:serine/threonine-protein kinase